MEEKHLCKTSRECDFSSPEPKDTKCPGNPGCGQDEVSHGQHGEKEKHGFVKATLYRDEVEKDAVSHNGYNVDDAEGNTNPHVILLQAWDPHQDEGSRVIIAQVESDHHQTR